MILLSDVSEGAVASSSSSSSAASPPGAEWGEFLHKAGERFLSFDQIREEIDRETDRVAGSLKGVSGDPISLKIFSPKVPTLTLVDLPVIIKVRMSNEPPVSDPGLSSHH